MHDVQAQLVDPSKVAPEFREAAEKRRAEQLKQMACAKKADEDKVMPRERTAVLSQCLEPDGKIIEPSPPTTRLENHGRASRALDSEGWRGRWPEQICVGSIDLQMNTINFSLMTIRLRKLGQAAETPLQICRECYRRILVR